MESQTFFLQPDNSDQVLQPNYVNSNGTATLFNFSQESGNSLTNSETQTLADEGVVTAIADAQALFLDDPSFAFLSNISQVLGEDGTYVGTARSDASVISTYDINGHQPFSFEFSTSLFLDSKEIENPRSERSKALLNTSFLILDISCPESPHLLDYFTVSARLNSSRKKGNAKWYFSEGFSLISESKVKNIDGDDDVDFVQADLFGLYSRYFSPGTQLAIVKVENSYAAAAGDSLIGRLGDDVTYGSVCNDRLRAKRKGSKIYAGLGNDIVIGRKGDDILEGGMGNDRLFGNRGDDSLSGGMGDDILVGGLGNDILVGGHGADTFIFKRRQSLKAGEFDIVEDFEVGIDHLKLSGWNHRLGSISQTQAGALFTSFSGGEILFKGVSALDLEHIVQESHS